VIYCLVSEFLILNCFVQMHTILDEIIFSGQVLETSSEEVMKAVEEIARCLSNSQTILVTSLDDQSFA